MSAKMKKMGLLTLLSNDDTYVALVGPASMKWIDEDPNPLFVVEWEESPPPAVIDEMKELMPSNDSESVDYELIDTDSGSYENDKARLLLEQGMQFDSIREALSWAKRNKVEILDTYEGLMY